MSNSWFEFEPRSATQDHPSWEKADLILVKNFRTGLDQWLQLEQLLIWAWTGKSNTGSSQPAGRKLRTGTRLSSHPFTTTSPVFIIPACTIVQEPTFHVWTIYFLQQEVKNVCMNGIYLLFTIFIPMEKLLPCVLKEIFLARFRTKLRIIQCFQVKKSFVESVLFFSGSWKQNSSLIACADSRSLSIEIMSSLTLKKLQNFFFREVASPSI